MPNPADGIAIIGMAGRFPGADNVTEFWHNVRDGVDSISRFDVNELEIAGIDECVKQPNYVRARSILSDVDRFDASFFGILPREAELIDPQQRVFLECCWEALEDAGYNPHAFSGAIAVFAGCSANTYFLRNVCTGRRFVEDYTSAYQVGSYQTLLGSNHDFLATRVSYKLDLKGPAFTMQAGCSTSLLAICQACQTLLSYQADMALAGGVSITFPQKRGYFYQEGGMVSPDGRCRPFDADAQGTVFGSGSAVVLLKRLEDAVADGDHIYAVVRGFAMNNDGSNKIGYTAPSIEGQAEVIAMAHAAAGVDPQSISYIEAHGTATPLGDPIEFAALTRAFRTKSSARNYCALGAAKANVGHLDVAAGVTGLINAVQALVHKKLPPLLHFKAPNPRIDLEKSPFYVNTELVDWQRGKTPRRAGVSAFGVGGTNAHVVLEEAPDLLSRKQRRPGDVLVLSARTPAALEQATDQLIRHLKNHPDIDIDSVACTLQAGRRAFDHRRAVACTDRDDAIKALEGRGQRKVINGVRDRRDPSIVFMFPGQGAQQIHMGAGLYRDDECFRDDIDVCAQILTTHLGVDLREMLFPVEASAEQAAEELRQTRIAQPALFVIGYALARLWTRWGIRPEAMIGHSIGEFVAACLAGVFTLEDALAMVAARGRLMQDLPVGAMLSVRLPATEVAGLLGSELSIAAVNSPALCVVSGLTAAITTLQQSLDERGVGSRRLVTSHGFHSAMMDPIIEPFTDYLRRFRFESPTIPYVSSVSGTWVTEAEATDPAYWARHVRQPVQFSRGIETLQADAHRVFLESGPGQALCTLVRQHRGGTSTPLAVPSLAGNNDTTSDTLNLLQAAGNLWVYGAAPNWDEMHGPDRRRCSLPTYPFERERYWIKPPKSSITSDAELAMSVEVQSSNETPMSVSNKSNAMTRSRRDRILPMLTEIFEELSGLQLSSYGPGATFIEMGFDSLFLTLVTQTLQTRLNVKITFRQLLDQESTLESLAAFIDSQLPPEALPEEPVVAEPVASTLGVSEMPSAERIVSPVTATYENGSATIESIVRDQLQTMSELMARQLEVFRNNGCGLQAPPANGAAAVTPPQSPVSEIAPGPSSLPQEFKPFGPYKPIQKGTIDGLTEKKSTYLNDFIRRYGRRTAKSKEHTQTHRRRLADPRVAAGFRTQWKEIVYPIVTVKSKGSRLWDVDGNEYVDILNGFGPIMLGHAPDFVVDAVAEQLKKGFEIGPQTQLAGEVADLVCEMTGMERATFCNTGSEAVMAAIRIARTVTGRKKFVLFAGAYHGTFDEVLVRGTRKDGEPHTLPVAPGIPPESVGNAIVLEYGTPQSLDYIRAHAKELAAVLVEPVQSRHPALQPVEFLQEIRRITSEANTALIFDEVVTGFRVHPGGAQAMFGIRADLVTYGKVIGGGLPVGILAGSAAFMDALDGGMWQYGDDSYPERGVTFFAGTFVRHPLALAAVKSVLLHLQKEGPNLQLELGEKTARFAETLNAFFAARSVPARIEHFGSIFYFSFPADVRFASLLYYHLREKGVHIQEGFPCFLTTAHTDADIDHVVRAFKESIIEMQNADLLPGPSGSESSPAPVEIPKATPLTEAQVEILLSALVSDEASCAFNESFTLRMRGSLNTNALRDTIQEIVNRHEALRISLDPKEMCQRSHSRMPLEFPAVDISMVAPDERAAHLKQLIRLDAARPFDLEHGPLVRVTLVQLSPDDHALIFTAHHIICDGWSTKVLLTDLKAIYNAKCSGESIALSRPSSFHDYATSQAEWQRNPDQALVEKWWLQKYAEPVQPLELPTDRPRGSVKSSNGNTARGRIDVATTQRIKQFGAQNGCTLFATLFSGFNVLLHRLTNQDDIVVGVPAAGQALVDGSNLVGHCVHFLPLRSTIREDASVKEYLAQAKRALLDAYDHQNYTYGSLVRALAQPRDPARLPLVEVQFNLDRAAKDLNLSGLQCEVDPNPKAFANFDLFLNISDTDHGLILDCDYNTDLFDEATIHRWLVHYQTILEGMVADPANAVTRMPLLTDAEKRTMLTAWNATDAAFPREKCIHHLIQEQAARTPDAVAVVFNAEEITYRQLDQRTNQLANYLKKCGVARDTPVAICMERSVEMLVGIIGVLKAGGAYVPLDPNYPSQRIHAVLEDAKPALLLTQKEVTQRLGSITPRVICVESERAIIDAQPNARPGVDAASDQLAYLIFTSGSTGRPKGVPVTHRNVVNMLCAMAREPGISAHDRLFAVTTVSFDIAVLELFLPLIVGARVIIAASDVLADGFKLKSQLAESKATILQTTPASWRLLLAARWGEERGLKILCGGEAFPRDLADALLPRASSVWNMYGPTETTVWSAVAQVENAADSVPVGRPIANTQFYVVDRARQLAPIGVPGELLIGGEGVARGYWNDPKQTAEKFIQDTFGNNPNARLYRTGDLVRYLPDGRLEFLGRMDTQVKVRGFRIETAEVESAIGEHRAVKECVVVAREDVPGDRRLVAYVVPNDASFDTRELRGVVASKLPEYMVPSVFVPLPELPRTANGKINRKALPAVSGDAALSERDYVAPRNPREEKLASICAQVLSLKRVSVEESLFDLGADSLQIFRVVARAVDAGINLSLKQILTHRTVAAIAADVERVGNVGSSNGGPQLAPAPRDQYRVRKSQLASF